MAKYKKINLSKFKPSKRLKLWAKAIEQVRHLKMSTWGEGGKGAPTFPKLKRGECGFAACALGTAACCFEGAELVREDGSDVLDVIPANEAHSEAECAAAMFGISREQAYSIIMPYQYEGHGRGDPDEDEEVPKEKVIARILGLAQEYKDLGQ